MVDELSPNERRALDAWEPMLPPSDFVARVHAAKTLPKRIAVATATVAMLAAAVVAVVVLRPWDWNRAHSLASITRTEGPIERQPGTGAWQGATVGTEVFQGDAVRTSDGRAELRIVGGGAAIRMDKYTVLRFGGAGKAAKINVELGAIELSGSGNVALDVGNVSINGSVRIAAKGQGISSIELLLGNAQVAALDGRTLELTMGSTIDLTIGTAIAVATVPEVDAGVPVMVVDAAPLDSMMIEVAGKKAEVLVPGATKWSPLPPGLGSFEPDSQLRFGASTSAKISLTSGTFTLANGPSTVLATGSAQIHVPGGVVELAATAGAPAQVKIEVNGRDTSVTMLQGNGRLVGGVADATLALVPGEAATVERSGVLRQKVKIPAFSDMEVTVGESFAVHDPKGATAIKFRFDGKCTGGGTVELDDDPRFRTARVSAGANDANHMVNAGAWSYRARCTTGGVVGSGRVLVLRDSGRRPLPKSPATNRIDADGRSYRISYQSTIPRVDVKVSSGPGWKLHLATGGAEEVFDANSKGVATIAPSKLAETTYTFWGEKDGAPGKVSMLTIAFDQTAPQVYIESPAESAVWSAQLDVRGAVLVGWTPSIDGVTIPVDARTRRFSAQIPRPATHGFAIKLTHPKRGVHYYVRRQGK